MAEAEPAEVAEVAVAEAEAAKAVEAAEVAEDGEDAEAAVAVHAGELQRPAEELAEESAEELAAARTVRRPPSRTSVGTRQTRSSRMRGASMRVQVS